MAMNCEDDTDLRRLTDGFCRFRQWYCYDSVVSLSAETDGEDIEQSMRDAITTARLEKLGGKGYRYDFTGAMDYPLDSYEVSVASLVAAENGYEDSEAYVEDRPYDEEEDYLEGSMEGGNDEYLN